ncbi:MAG: hypothetical protein B7Z15_18850 [Rhizobiales bacterium 32-66-8]|nr:MAG: hypothetical protein B7Z15_18850 [Rhizobiales bacterium 32-66-8]
MKPVPPVSRAPVPHAVAQLKLERAKNGARLAAKPSPAFGGVGNWRLGNSGAARIERNAPDWRLPLRRRLATEDPGVSRAEAEEQLWFQMRAHRVAGLSFRRRHPLGRYDVDFVAKAARLIVEVGDAPSETRLQAARRAAYFEKKGFTRLRFSTHEVLHQMSHVLTAITAAASALQPATGRADKGAGDDR